MGNMKSPTTVAESASPSASKHSSRGASISLAIIVGLLVVPLLLLGYFVVDRGLDEIRMTARQAAGARYLEALMPVLFAISAVSEVHHSEPDAGGVLVPDESFVDGDLRQDARELQALVENRGVIRAELLWKTRDLIRSTAVKSDILLDASAERHFLADAFVKQLPDFLLLTQDPVVGSQLERFKGELTAAQNAAFESLSTAVRADKTGELASALNGKLATFDMAIEHYRNSIAAAGDGESVATAPELQAAVRDAIMASITVFRESVERHGQALKWSLLLIGGLCGSAAAVSLAIASRMFHATFHKLDEVEIAYRKLSISESDAQQLAGQLQIMNDDIALLNRDLASNFQKLQDAQDDNIKKSKMAQLGALTAMVAHELRNPLGAVRNSIYHIDVKSGEIGFDISRPVQRINNAVSRCDGIITQLLDYSMSRQVEPKPENFDNWLQTVIEAEAESMPGKISVKYEPALGGAMLSVDGKRLAKAISNVLLNSAQALTARVPAGGGRGSLGPEVVIRTAFQNFGYEIVVTDNGPGIPADKIDQVLEPLFTTKSFGPGLGLPIAEQVVQQHGGRLSIASKPGEGTTVTLWLPPHLACAEAA